MVLGSGGTESVLLTYLCFKMLYSDLDENGNPKELYCYEYSMNEVPPTEGNLADYNDLSNIDWYVRKCPAFANNGCFRGNITVRATGLAINAFNKGTNKSDDV